MIREVSPETRKYLLNLPLYNGVSSVEIGLPKDAELWKIGEKDDDCKPIVYYGTSITQGGCASRPGMSAASILSRRLNKTIINLGFSGNGKMEVELATLLGEIDASMYILDCMANMPLELVKNRVVPFVEILRKIRPEIPIILVESREAPRDFLYSYNTKFGKWQAYRFAYEELMAKGIKNLHYINGINQVGSDGEGTVDGSHPTDLGFWRQADFFEPKIRSILLLNGK